MDVSGEDAFQFENPVSTAKYEECVAGLEKGIPLAEKFGVKIAGGTDRLFDPPPAAKQGRFLAKMKKWYTHLRAAEEDGQLRQRRVVKLCGPRDPYPGEFRVVEDGGLGDLIDVGADAAKNFLEVMKDGKLYKDALQQARGATRKEQAMKSVSNAVAFLCLRRAYSMG